MTNTATKQARPALVGAKLGTILAVHLPLTALAIGAAMRRPGASVLSILGGMAFGYAFWTFFEYAFHRWFLHGRGALRPMYIKFHLDHHRHADMNDPDHRGLKLALTIGSMAFTHAWVGLAFGATAFWVAAVAGYNLGYCAYEVLHWVHHATSWASRAREGSTWRDKAELHEHHHFHGPDTNYGFITSFWDRLFGTYASPVILGNAARG